MGCCSSSLLSGLVVWRFLLSFSLLVIPRVFDQATIPQDTNLSVLRYYILINGNGLTHDQNG